MNRLNPEWYSNLPKEDRQDFEEYLRINKKILDRLHEICYNRYREAEVRDRNYDSPSWAYHQAHSNGYREALELIMKLCKPDQG